uniref:Uncharacterized protein n=1 Tax=Megaselia scalaris TaxID=36166 RepID=T1GC94_MEGSC
LSALNIGKKFTTFFLIGKTVLTTNFPRVPVVIGLIFGYDLGLIKAYKGLFWYETILYEPCVYNSVPNFSFSFNHAVTPSVIPMFEDGFWGEENMYC